MIDQNIKPYYDKMFSVFIGIVLVLIIHNLYDSPRTVILISDTYKKNRSKCNGIKCIS
jgi:polyribonucleotide nucleotidyltransferase